MKSTNKTYLHGLDHLRAFAAFLVLYWHGIHRYVSAAYTPDNYLMGLLEEGQTGVSLFITITGFIFTYIIADKNIIYSKFLYNRFIRIFPLLFIATLFISAWNSGINKGDHLTILKFFNLFGGGTVGVTWTLVIEFQFYLLFPIVYPYFRDKYHGRINKYFPYIMFIVLGKIFCLIYFSRHGNYQEMSYETIFGRIDQFMLGIMAALFLRDIQDTKLNNAYLGLLAFILAFSALVVFYYHFNQQGGFYHRVDYPSPSRLWLVMPTLEGCLYASMILGWIIFTSNWNNIFSKTLSYFGAISYSTYLLHLPAISFTTRMLHKFDVSFSSDKFIDGSIVIILLVYPVILLFSSLSYELLEKPFLSKRVKYTV